MAWAPMRGGIDLTDSGTSALTRAALRRTTGAPWLLPAYCCYDSPRPMGGRCSVPPVRYRSPHPLSEPASLRRALAPGAGQMVVAHLFGVPVASAPVGALAEEFGARIVEDAAQAAGIRYGNQRAGSLGDIGVLSFGRGKGMTGGAGGALLMNDVAMAAVLGALDAEILEAPGGTNSSSAAWPSGCSAAPLCMASLPPSRFSASGRPSVGAPHRPGGWQASHWGC